MNSPFQPILRPIKLARSGVSPTRTEPGEGVGQAARHQASGQRQSENLSGGHRRPEHVACPISSSLSAVVPGTALSRTTSGCRFIYRNLGTITEIDPTMDTHTAMQIFHPIFLVNDAGEHPQPLTPIALEEVEKVSGR